MQQFNKTTNTMARTKLSQNFIYKKLPQRLQKEFFCNMQQTFRAEKLAPFPNMYLMDKLPAI